MRQINYVGPEPPQHIKDLILRIGGRNPWGAPMYRLVHASRRFAPSGGQWTDWAEGVAIKDRQDGRAVPWRSVIEIRNVPRYPAYAHLWVLEKWTEPSAYGTPEDWYKPEIIGGTMRLGEDMNYFPALGEYPYQGDYEHIGYAFPAEAVTAPVLENAVGRFERGLEQMPSTPKARVWRAMQQARLRDETEKLAHRAKVLDALSETDFAFGGAPFSAGSGEKRSHSMNDFARRAGITSHTGRS